MNAERVLQTMPVSMGRIKGRTHSTYWVRVPEVRKTVSERVARNTAYQRAKRRSQILKKLLDWSYIGICLVCNVCMTVTMLNMAGLLPF